MESVQGVKTLSEAQERRIIQALAADEVFPKLLARRFGVSEWMIWKVGIKYNGHKRPKAKAGVIKTGLQNPS